MEYEVGKWYRLKTAFDWYAKFKCINNGRWVYENKINIKSGDYETQLFSDTSGWLVSDFREDKYSCTLLTDLSEIQKYLPEGHVDKVKDKFLKGDYIVCLNTPEKHSCFPRNYIFKQKYDSEYLSPEKNAKGSTSGWAAIDFLSQGEYGKWRYATSEEIVEYNKLGKPYDVTTLATKKYDYEVVHCTTEEELDFVCQELKQDKASRHAPYCIHLSGGFDTVETCKEDPTSYKIYSFDEWCKNNGYTVPEYQVGGWVRCIQDCIEVCKVGEYYQIDKIIDQALIRVRVNNNTRYGPYSTRDLFTTNYYKPECEWVGMEKPTDESIISPGQTLLYTGEKLTGWEYSSLDNIKLKGIIKDVKVNGVVYYVDTIHTLDLSCFNKQKVSLLSLEDEPTVFNTNLKKIKKIKIQLLETN